MCVNDSEAAVAFRQDIPSYDVPANILVSFKKAFSPLDKEAQEGAKPGRCLICGEEMPKVLRLTHRAQILPQRDCG